MTAYGLVAAIDVSLGVRRWELLELIWVRCEQDITFIVTTFFNNKIVIMVACTREGGRR